MIIEKITAFTIVKITWGVLEEILHLIHVGHIVGKASYKGVSSVKHATQYCCQEWQDKKDPTQRRMREAKTPYDFKATGNATQSINDINTQAESYLAELNSSIENLQKAIKRLSKIHNILTKFVKALKSNSDAKFSNFLLQLKNNFIAFEDKFDQFLFSIKPPPRQLLYVADLDGNEMGVINQYNKRLKTMKDYFGLLKKAEQEITNQFEQGLKIIPKLLSSTSSSSTDSPEQLQQIITQCKQTITQCMDSPENTSETMRAMFQNDRKLATTCADIIQLFASFRKLLRKLQKIEQTTSEQTTSEQTTSEQTISLENNPAWFPLLIGEKEIEEVGQRIFLHAMNEAKISDEEKLLIAKIFLRKPVSTYLMKQIEVNELAYEMANTLRLWQIEKCEQLTQFLSTLTEGVQLPSRKEELDERLELDGQLEWELLEWLKTQREEQNSIYLFKKILVSPCRFSQCSIESARTQLKDLSLDENIDILIQKYLNSHWGAIWEKSAKLIQLPPKFKTDILPIDRTKKDTSKNPNVVSSVMQELATKLITDLDKLKAELVESRSDYSKKLKELNPEKEKALAIHKDQGHENGVERIKQLQSSIQDTNSSLDSSLVPYLYQPKTTDPKATDPSDKARRVPTIDDLSYVIYRGVDPNGICQWQTPYQNVPQNDKLTRYFMPDQQQGETRTKAWLYACTTCQANALPAFSHLFTTNRLLALENTPESQAAIKNSLSIQAFFKGSKKISSIATNSKALNGVTPETVEETEIAFQQLQDYYVLALARVHSEYRNQLSFGEQLKCLLKNLFKVGLEIGKDRLEHVQVYMGDLCTVLSGEHVEAINKAIITLNENYNSLRATAKKINKSQLYTIMDKAIKGPIAEIRRQMDAQMSKTPSDPNSTVKQIELENERKEIEAREKEVQAREAEIRKEIEAIQAREKEAQAREEKEREEKEAAQAREKEERKEKEAAQAREEKEREEKEAAQAEIERLKALLKKQVPPQPIATGSRFTLFPAPAASQAANTTAENPVLPKNSCYVL